MADHPVFAALYERSMARTEAQGLRERRCRLLAPARGRVLEVGGGTGLNLDHYPAGAVTELVILEPDGAMARRLRPRAAAAAVPCEVDRRGIDEAAFPEGSFDTIVSTLALCTVPDVDRALRLVRGWMAPGGRLLFLEHVVGAGWRAGLRRAVTPVWSLAVGGCRLDRDIPSALRRAGLYVDECERFPLPAGGVLLAECVQGMARPALGHAWSGPGPPS